MSRRGLLFPRGCHMRLSESCFRKVVIGVGKAVTLRRLTDAERAQIRSDYRQLRRQRLSPHGTVRRISEARRVLPEVVAHICGDLIDADQPRDSQ